MALSLSDYSMPLDPPVPPLLPLCPSYNKQQLISPALFLLDFSKGFDTVRHSALASSLSQLEITDSIYNFIICFLQDRSHVTRFAGLTSVIAYINGSTVQGSGFGPSSFDVVAAGLHPLSASNSLAIYADDIYLLVPASARSSVSSELVSISKWPTSNNPRLNADELKELILHKRTTSYDPPQPIPGVERLASIKIGLLGITLTGDFSTAAHITKVLESDLSMPSYAEAEEGSR